LKEEGVKTNADLFRLARSCAIEEYGYNDVALVRFIFEVADHCLLTDSDMRQKNYEVNEL